jgi:anaerobic selenocysteine-containing dehydrogenase
MTTTAPGSRTVLGTCHHDCPDSCGWVATVEDGVAVKLRGNPDHPYSQGELCPKVNRFLDRVYSPDRILHPLIRTGAKGTGEFRTATWDEALALTAARLHDVIDTSGGAAVLPWGDAGTQGLLQMTSLDRRFFARIGSSRQIGSLCGHTASAGVAATLGTGRASDPTVLRHAQHIILWGTNTRLTNRHLWPFVEEARGSGARVVVIDPIRTITADAADHFIQPLPGTDAALMLAMMHVLIRDDLIDRDYIAEHTIGFQELAERVAEWDPARAGSVTGVDQAEIERLAADYGTIRPSFIRTLIGAEHHENGAMFFRTLACLPTLTGSWKELGGGMARSVGTWFDVNIDDSVFDEVSFAVAERRGINMNHLGRTLTNPALDPPIKALFVWNGNPVVTVPDAGAIRRGMERADLFTVVSEQFLTDTAMYADVVFPATTQLEHRDVVPAWGHLYLGWNEPAIAPQGESVPNTELWRRLSRAMGFTEAELFEDDESLIQRALDDVDLATLRTQGYLRLDLPDPLLPYADGGFTTPSGKAEFRTTNGVTGPDPLPNFTPPLESPLGDPRLAVDYPLLLLTPKHHARFLNSSYSHLPKHGPLEGGPFVEMHEADASERGLGHGDTATVWNARARLRLPVRISDRLRPGVVAVPFGWWGADHGEAATANSLTSAADTDWGGGVAYSDTLVEVRRAASA